MSIKKNFSSRLSLYILLVSAGLMIALTILLGTMAYNVVMNNSKKQAEMSLDQTILRIENVITEVERAVDNLDWVVRQNLGREDRLYEVTRELVSANPNIIGSAVAFEPGFYKGKERLRQTTYY